MHAPVLKYQGNITFFDIVHNNVLIAAVQNHLRLTQPRRMRKAESLKTRTPPQRKLHLEALAVHDRRTGLVVLGL